MYPHQKRWSFLKGRKVPIWICIPRPGSCPWAEMWEWLQGTLCGKSKTLESMDLGSATPSCMI